MIESVLSGLVTLLAFLAMLGVLVLVHELGHFLTATWLGIKVEEFGLGYPPRARVLFERKGVKYTLNWLPIGGFVRFGSEGESIYGVGSLSAAAPWRKILVLIAGPLMNLVLACAIFIGLFMAQGVPTAFDGARISTVYPNTPAAQAGFQDGDMLMELAGQPIGTTLSILPEIGRDNIGKTIPAVVERAGQRITLTVTPGPWRDEQQEERVGFGFGYGPNVRNIHTDIFTSITAGIAQTFQVLIAFLDGLGTLFLSLFGLASVPEGGVTGVVGMARGTGEIIQSDGWVGFLRWSALISLNLFLVNLLPIPALDGSHIVFSLVEIVRRGKKVPPDKEAMVHAFGFIVLMGLMVLITISDVANWLRGGSVLGGG